MSNTESHFSLIKLFYKNSILPVFNSADVEVWFNTCEALFHAHDIADDKLKYKLILRCFTPSDHKQLGAYMGLGSSENHYKKLIDGIFAVHVQTSSKLEEIVEKKFERNVLPSQILHHMRMHFMKTNFDINEKSLRKLLNTKLSTNMLIPLTKYNDLPLKEYVEQADAIFKAIWSKEKISPGSSQIGMKSTTKSSQEDKDLQDVETRNKKAEVLLRKIDLSFENSKHCNKQTKKVSPYCFFHTRFRHKSKKCRKPCNWHFDFNCDKT